MEDSAQCIEFTIDELQALHSVSNIAQVLKICFLYASDEAFHALCSIVMNGKDLSSTSKRIKRDARIELYSKIVSTQHPHLHDYTHKRLSYFEFALACRTFSERWSTQFPIDELLSLAILVDKHETGEVTFDGFMEFIDDVDSAFHSNPSYPNDALDALYDGRREHLFKHVMVAFTSIDLRNKLAYLSSLASQFHMQPLTALYELTHAEEEAEAENVIGFVIQLTGAVNRGIKEVEAARELLAAQNQANRSGFSSPNGSTKSSQSSPRNTPRSTNGQRSGQASPFGSINLGHDHDAVVLGSDLEKTTGSLDLSAIQSLANHAEHHKDSHTTQKHHTPERAAEAAQSEPLSNPDAVLISLLAFQNKAQQIAMVLASNKTAAVEGHPETVDSAPAAAPTLSQAELLLQLQLMEDEIRKAKLSIDPSLAHSDHHHSSHGAGEGHAHHHHSSSHGHHGHHTGGSTHQAEHAHHSHHQSDQHHHHHVSTPNEHKHAPKSTPSSSKAAPQSPHIPSASSSVCSGSVDGRKSTASRRIYASSPHSPRSVHSHSASRANHSQSQELSFANGGMMNLSLSRSKLDSSGHINRSSPLARHVDLSIFKSPTSHRRNASKNVFDDAKLTWVSAKGVVPKKERFQSTNDLMLAKEVNPVFFSNDV